MNGTKTLRKQCKEDELAHAERDWQAQGYRFVEKRDEKELRPMEYLKLKSAESAASFGGAKNWLLVRREQ